MGIYSIAGVYRDIAGYKGVYRGYRGIVIGIAGERLAYKDFPIYRE